MAPVDNDHPKDLTPHFQFHATAGSVVAAHGFSLVFIQACIAILILVGFESVTSMGEEAKNAKRDIPRAVLLSLGIQGLICYLVEYFAANYFLNSGYTLANAGASGAPLGDMMVMVGTWLFGSYSAGRAFMLVQAFTVFLALIGTTLSCLSTGARVTYAMGKDEEVPGHFGMLHGKTLTPHRSIWTLAILSAVIGIVTVAGLPRRHHAGAARPEVPRLLVQLRGLQRPGDVREAAEHAGHRHAGEQLRNVPALHAHLLHRHRGLPRAPHVQRLQAHVRAAVRSGGQPDLHALLPDRAVRRGGDELEGAVHRARRRRSLGRIRRALLPAHQQGEVEVGLRREADDLASFVGPSRIICPSSRIFSGGGSFVQPGTREGSALPRRLQPTPRRRTFAGTPGWAKPSSVHALQPGG